LVYVFLFFKGGDLKEKDNGMIGLLGGGISGCFRNLTSQEEKETSTYLKKSENNHFLDFGDGKKVGHPLIASRMKRIIGDHGIEAIEIFNKLVWGHPEDQINKEVDFKIAIKMAVELKKQ